MFKAFVNSFDFRGMRIDEALRQFLQSFRLGNRCYGSDSPKNVDWDPVIFGLLIFGHDYVGTTQVLNHQTE